MQAGLLPRPKGSPELLDVPEKVRVHLQLLLRDLFGSRQVLVHVVVVALAHRVLQSGYDLALDCDQLSLLLYALQVVVEHLFLLHQHGVPQRVLLFLLLLGLLRGSFRRRLLLLKKGLLGLGCWLLMLF